MRMMGKIHDHRCDCNIEEHVSGRSEKCNYRYGVKRRRSIEKRQWKNEVY